MILPQSGARATWTGNIQSHDRALTICRMEGAQESSFRSWLESRAGVPAPQSQDRREIANW
jgi:hypothetical protein